MRAFLVFFTGQVVLIYTGIWLIDATRLPELPQLVLHILMTVLALIALRVGMQLALMHEQPGPLHRQPCCACTANALCPTCPSARPAGGGSRVVAHLVANAGMSRRCSTNKPAVSSAGRYSCGGDSRHRK